MIAPRTVREDDGIAAARGRPVQGPAHGDLARLVGEPLDAPAHRAQHSALYDGWWRATTMAKLWRQMAGVVLAVAVTGCATPGTTPSATVTTLMPDSERWFRINWDVSPERGGATRRLSGYVENTYGEAAARVQLLAQALSTSGDVVGQRLQWVHGAIPGFGRVYYEVPGMPPADH